MHPLMRVHFLCVSLQGHLLRNGRPGSPECHHPDRMLLSGRNSDRRHYFFLLRKKNLKLEIGRSFFELIKIVQKNIREIDSAGIHHRSKL
jgi:hypothetical protein